MATYHVISDISSDHLSESDDFFACFAQTRHFTGPYSSCRALAGMMERYSEACESANAAQREVAHPPPPTEFDPFTEQHHPDRRKMSRFGLLRTWRRLHVPAGMAVSSACGKPPGPPPPHRLLSACHGLEDLCACVTACQAHGALCCIYFKSLLVLSVFFRLSPYELLGAYSSSCSPTCGGVIWLSTVGVVPRGRPGVLLLVEL